MRLRLVPDYRMQVYAFRGKSLPYILENYLQLAASCHSFTLGLNFGTGECTTWLRHKIPSTPACASENDLDPVTSFDKDLLGDPLVGEVPFYELGPGVPGGELGWEGGGRVHMCTLMCSRHFRELRSFLRSQDHQERNVA
jgi:hypothetical protein